MYKFIIGILLISLNLFGNEISPEDFLKLYDNKKEELSKIEIGMSSTVEDTFTIFMGVCRPDEPCSEYECKVKVTSERTIVAAYNQKYFVHEKRTTEDLTNDPRCNLSNVEAQLDLYENDLFEITRKAFEETKYITKIKKAAGSVYFISLEFPDINDEVISEVYAIDINESAFYFPLWKTQTLNRELFSRKTYIEKYKDPRSFDLKKIKLCFEYPIADRFSSIACTEEENYEHIVQVE